MISKPVVVNLSYELILKFKVCSTSLQAYTHAFLPDHPQKLSDCLKNGDWLGRKWRGWSRNQSMISTRVVVNRSYELILKFK